MPASATAEQVLESPRPINARLAPEPRVIRIEGSTLAVLGIGIALFALAFGAFTHLSNRIESLDAKQGQRIDNVEARLSSRIDSLEAGLSSRIDRLDAKIDRLSERLDKQSEQLSQIIINQSRSN